jgi:pyroglutamyl-peptidase
VENETTHGGPVRVLVTGFEPFGGSPVNPSMLVAGSLAERRWSGAAVRAALLPVVGGTGRGSARRRLDDAIAAHRPDVLLMLGEAHVRGAVSVERVAVNVRDYRIADNAGVTVRAAPIVAGAADRLPAALPVDDVLAAARATGVPAECSADAGTFLCNEVMFHALERRVRVGVPAFAGFIHLPQLPEQFALRPVDAPPMPAEDAERAVAAIAGRLAGLCVRARGAQKGA